MNRLLLFIHLGILLFTVTCFRIESIDDGNPKGVKLLQSEVLGNSEQRSVPIRRRQVAGGGFNWGSIQNTFRNRPNPSNIMFDNSDFNDDDVFNFLPNDRSTTSTPSTPSTPPIRIPGMATTRSACEDNCPATSQFDPVCGNNNVTYTNIYWLECAQRCGRNVDIKYRGSCPRVP